jgi:glycerol-3-phosphate dehydrogenase (NAD(P)+)
MAKVTIIGAGLMGSAMAWPLRDNGHEVALVGTHLDDEIIESCVKTRFHPRLRRNLPEGVKAFFFKAIDGALEGADIILCGVNSLGVRWITDVLGPRVRPGHKVLSITKGLEVTGDGRVLTFPEVIEAGFPEDVRGKVHAAAVGGPCIAGELAGRRQTCVVFGSKDIAAARELAGVFRTAYYHVWPTAELLSLEAGVALKNAYTLGPGYAYGLLEKEGGPDAAGASMHNLASAFFAQGIREIGEMIRVLGGNPDFAGVLPGAGDLYVTTMGGRTVRLGKLLGQGKSYKEAREIMAGETLESVEIVRAMGKLLPRLEEKGRTTGKDFPLMRMLVGLIGGKAPAEVPLDEFFRGMYEYYKIHS